LRYAERTIEIEAALRDLRSRDPRVRVRAADALGGVDEALAEQAREALRPLLRDDDADVRYTTALSLGDLKDRTAIEALVEQMDGDGHPVARQGAVIALGLIGDPGAAPHLVRALHRGPPDVRFQAGTSLARVDPEGAQKELRRVLHDPDPEVRASAAAALGGLQGTGCADAVASLLEDDAGEVRFEAAVTLARLGDARGAGTLALHLRDKARMFVAAEHLFRSPAPEAASLLRDALRRWLTPPVLKVWLAGALTRLGEDQGRVEILNLLASRRLAVRGLCIQVLGELGEPWAIQTLEALAASPAGESWQEEIAEALRAPADGR
jgi:HEAT repeat protein